MSTRRRTRGADLAIALGVTGVFVSVMATSGGDRSFYMAHIGLGLAPIIATIFAIRAARRAHPSFRRAWTLLALACGSWAAGELTWSVYELILELEPFPSPADAGFLGLVPLSVAGVLSLPTDAPTGRGKAGMVLEGLVIAASVAIVSWVFVLEDTFSAGGSLMEFLIAVAYPVGDIIVIAIVLSAVTRAFRSMHQPVTSLVFLSLGLGGLAFADSSFLYLIAIDGYSSGGWTDGGWMLGFALVAVAANRVPRPGQATVEQTSPVSRRAASTLPYLTVAIAVGVAITIQIRDGALDNFVFWSVIITLMLLTAREMLSMWDNHDLARTLEERVMERTAELEASGRRFRSLVQHSSDVIAVVDRRGIITYLSPSARTVFGLEPDTVIDYSVSDILHPDDASGFDALIDESVESSDPLSVNFRLRNNDGSIRHCEATVTNLLHDPAVEGLVFNTRDITTRRTLQEQLTHQAFHDALTGLPNRRRFQQRLEEALERHETTGRRVAVLFCDLDGFKRVNDSLGHTVGDELIQRIGARINNCVRPDDTVARVGGDEFAVILENVVSDGEVNAVAARVTESVRRPVTVGGREVYVSTSIGIALAEGRGHTADELLRDADVAMYSAKSRGTGIFQRYHSAMRTPVDELLGLEADLHRTLQAGELQVHYQPTIDLRTSHVRGFEALARWNHPTRGPIGPDVFVSLAEQSDLIIELGRFVLDAACGQLAQWHGSWGDDSLPYMAVNVSGSQLRQSDIVADVAAALDRTGVDARYLMLELTESILVEHDLEVVAKLEQLRSLGVRIAIDDFGTGYSSLSYLHRFPVDVIKIDRTFVDLLLEDRSENTLAAVIVRLGNSLGLTTVAEGIEHPSQLDMLKSVGCDLAQGYLFSPALPPEEIVTLFEEFAHGGWEAAVTVLEANRALEEARLNP